jgi:hypothetical protein
MAQWKQREVCPAKVGDKIYWIGGGHWGEAELVTVTGECEDGSGYLAFSQRWADEHPDSGDPTDPDFNQPGSIHTCNGFICKTHTEARAESLRIAKVKRERWIQKRKEATQVVQYLDWVIARKGKH